MPCRRSKTSSKKSQARFKALKAACKLQVHQLKEVTTLTEFGILQSGQICQQEEETQFHNELWAIIQKECWEAQKKIIQQDEEIVELRKELGQLKKDYEIATFTWHAPVSHFFQVPEHLIEYKPDEDSTDSSFSTTFYDQIFVADGLEYVDDNNINKQL
ncbi:hypothetical protein GLOIN_2v1766875 [Rhizophagus irregularis DAOM 181602=DAOM 197198]|uniref:Uncharacterized protein n=1 Tax=Rhizophagus irregularis (strain DAOM 181602 / DAOM 197198 / MUCL 43194) TaxID=747089 RepID=U9SSD0_RHIID|nr:hypothetical protein GLOIN_2v1766875 [Rhizophagus irregularis DAOM 181602=DAOM 197198]POG78399.1 hypothetical protein GLOIN_2v1766875 [Rhizophagus irregularis DAOM 181602=DAOM 197198]GBC40002.1 hypothetical protein GLOIN_2v1766875 [Rhizophagus irregularis DAOM 181602=DAOM 197198]|eukprot:XP_025185265.1 hypothetical protein GLOIN_2v1766875 [Rhizophagus irregularis DAOM 181602=DAOM 197198]